MKLESSCQDNQYISPKDLHLCGQWMGWGKMWCLRNPTCHSWMIFLRKKMEHYRMVWETPSSASHKYCTHRAILNTQEISEFTMHHEYLIALGFHSLLELGQKDISISIPLHAYNAAICCFPERFWSYLLELIQSISQGFWMTEQNMPFPPQNKIGCNKDHEFGLCLSYWHFGIFIIEL